jgi:hypothetical protein
MKCVLGEMKRIYPYDEKKTEISNIDLRSMTYNRVEIKTKDETTGIEIVMAKVIKNGEYDDENIN